MDELTFDQNTPNTDTTQNIEGYDNQVEEIQKSYPEQDWRTPAQVEAEEQGQVEGQAPVQQQPDQINEVATQVANQVGQQLGITPQPQEAPQEQPEVEERTPGRFANYVDPTTGLVSTEALKAAGVSDEVIRITNAQYDWLPEEKTDFDSWREAGGDDNLEATLAFVNKIRSSQDYIDRYDRNGDGQFTFSDYYDTSRMGEISPERDQQLTERWLTSLQNKDFRARLGALTTLEPMVEYIHQRRKGVLAPNDELDGEQMRASSSAGLSVTTEGILSAPEKIAAGFHAAANDDDPDTWFDWDASESKDAKLDDWLMGHKNPMSKAYAVNNPINRVWSDPIMFELGRYAPVVVATAATLPASATAITTGGAGLLSAKGAGMAALTTTKAFGVTWATETIPTNLFVDMNNSAMKTFHGGNKQTQQLMDAHPELHIAGNQLAHGIESPFSRKLEFMRGEMAWDSGGLLAGNILFKSLGKGFSALAESNWKQLQTSTKAVPKIQDPIDIYKARLQVKDDLMDAATDQTKIAAEGPSSKWTDPWATNGDLDSTYGAYKNQSYTAGQGNAHIRSSVYDVTNQFNELKHQIGIEGGTIDELFSPVERAQFGKFGIPDNWFDKNVDVFMTDSAEQLKRLNPLDRNLRNLAEDQLKNIQEILGRDAASLDPTEFWGKAFTDTPIKPGEVLSDVKKFVIKNLQVQDAVNNSLLRRLRDYADSTGEQIGKADIFAKDGPMRNIAKNLSMGLTQVKKTQFTWDLAAKRMKEAGGELTDDMVREINEQVAQRSAKLTQETNDGVKLMMQVLENSDSDELAEGILDVFKVSNDIHNWKDFDAWMRQKIKGGEFNGKVKTGALIHELQGVMVNSILSGPKTPLRALLGTTTNSYLNAINEAAGATLRRPFTGDVASQKASIAKLKGMFELIPEAMEVFRKNMKASFNANIADIRTRYSEPLTRGDNNWHLFEQWTERNGTLGDKAAFYMANVARNLNNNKLLSWSPRALAATDDTFKWLLARTRSKEIGMRQALEVAGDTHTKFSPDLMKQAEDIHMKNLLDADGNIDVGQDAWLEKQFKEVTLTSELTGFSKELDTLLRDKPLVRPFYLFARTGINGLNFTYKNTPLLGALHKESIDILRHTGDDFTPLFKYGIENADDLANARNLFAGRQAVGAATVTTFAGMYMAGQLTGNGPADRKLKQSWINAGWKPNHFYIGDVGFDYTTLEPYNTIFSAIADIGDNMELMGSEWAEKRLQAAAFVIGRGLTGKTYMQGLDQMLQIAQMKPGSLDKAGANIMNNSIPLAGMRNEFGKWANPHMKELNSDMWTSIRNRNQASEGLAGEGALPTKYDMLNGKPIKNWNIIGRSFNAISPVGLDIRNDTPGRRLLLDSNYDLKSTVYSYGGYSFVKSAKVRSEFQREIGSVPIEVGFKKFKNVEEALNHLATRDDVKESMAKMQADGKNPANWDIDPNNYPHNTLIDNVMNQARAKAFARLNQPNHPGNAALEEVKADKDGLDSKTRKTREDIINLSFPNKQVEQFPQN
tara:strand:+ start:3214 stop:7791 length:4578 start_codon:yes stop_codon:yes gene_type:complete